MEAATSGVIIKEAQPHKNKGGKCELVPVRLWTRRPDGGSAGLTADADSASSAPRGILHCQRLGCLPISMC